MPERITFGCQNLDAACAYLSNAGLQVTGPTMRPFGMRQMFFKDPDGYQLCLQWRA